MSTPSLKFERVVHTARTGGIIFRKRRRRGRDAALPAAAAAAAAFAASNDSTEQAKSATHVASVGHNGVLTTYAVHKSGNRFGQLCNGRASRLERLYSKHIVASNVKVAAAGGGKDAGHTIYATNEGDVYTCGCDRWQQLGLGASSAGSAGYTWRGGKIWQKSPQKVDALKHTKIVDVAAGADHSLALSDTGEVYAFGRGDEGQVSRGRPFVSPPSKCAALSPAVAIAAKDACSCSFSKESSQQICIGRCSPAIREALGRVLLLKVVQPK